MAGSDVSPLVTCEWLQDKMTSGGVDGLVIVDVSWSSHKDCGQEFAQRHIAGARYLDVMVGPHSELYPRSLPPQEVFQEAARAAGVCENSHVIVYSSTDNCGFFLSARAWWTFKVYGAKRVSILDGGLQKWLSLGYDVTSDASDVQRGDFTAVYTGQFRRSFEDMGRLVTSGHAVIVDSRSDQSFSSGHVPGAVSLPYAQLMDTDRQQMKTVKDVRTALEGVGVDVSKPFTSYCNSGMSSCTLAFAFALCGGHDFAVYQGGFTEWKNKAHDKIEKS